MTKHEVADLIGKVPQGLTPDDFLVALANEAVIHERERLAKKCERQKTSWGKYFAELIRNGGASD